MMLEKNGLVLSEEDDGSAFVFVVTSFSTVACSTVDVLDDDDDVSDDLPLVGCVNASALLANVATRATTSVFHNMIIFGVMAALRSIMRGYYYPCFS
jgi:hypothetical protein